jgi:ornithine cyclodeaminase/alanine dehydrogenase
MGRSNSAAVPGAEYVIVLFDRETSSIAAIVDANLITGYRTAATSAAALDRMAAPGAAASRTTPAKARSASTTGGMGAT